MDQITAERGGKSNWISITSIIIIIIIKSERHDNVIV